MSFKMKTILGIACIEIFVLAILIVTSLQQLKSSNERELASRAQTSAKLLATMTSDAVVSSDLATLDVLVDQALSNEGLVYVQIRNDAGLVLAEGGNVSVASRTTINAAEDTDFSDETIDVSAPISVGQTNFGVVEIGLSTSLLNSVIAAGTQRMLTIAGIEVVIVAIFGYFLGTLLTRQLYRLRDGAAKVAKGEFGYHMPVSGNDELASTAHSFNQMSTALAEYARAAKQEKDEAVAGRKTAENFLHNAINSVSQAIFIVGEKDELRFVNRAAVDLYGLSEDTVAAGNCFKDVLMSAYANARSDDDGSQFETMGDRLERLEAGEIQTWQSSWAEGSTIHNPSHAKANDHRRLCAGGHRRHRTVRSEREEPPA